MNSESRISRVLEPVNQLVILNAEATGRVLVRQNELSAELINASVHQVRVLTSAQSLRAAAESQRDFLKDANERVRAVTRENVETMRDARRDSFQVVRGIFSRTAEQVEEKVEEVVEEVVEKVATEKPARKAAAKKSSKADGTKAKASGTRKRSTKAA